MRQIAFLVARGMTQSPTGGFDMTSVSPIVRPSTPTEEIGLTLYVVVELDPEDGGREYRFSYTITRRLTREVDEELLLQATSLAGGVAVRAPSVPENLPVSSWGITFEVSRTFATGGPLRMNLYADSVPIATTILQVELD